MLLQGFQIDVCFHLGWTARIRTITCKASLNIFFHCDLLLARAKFESLNIIQAVLAMGAILVGVSIDGGAPGACGGHYHVYGAR